tara:strand:+ start:9057 stop:9350 length:294 start_codon:yes stop_codon:yes gene_type:complete
MIVKLVEIFESTGRSRDARTSYCLREVYVNADHVVCLREDLSMKKKLEANLLPEDMNSKQQFTRVSLSRGHTGIDLIVVGPPESVENKLKHQQVLRG